MKKNRFLVLGMLAVTLVLGLALTGCPADGGSSDSGPLDGTWEVNDKGVIKRLVCSGDNWTMSRGQGETFVDTQKGTLKVDGKTITLTPTHVKNGDAWVAATGENAKTQTATLSDDGKTIKFKDITFPKK